MKLHYTTLSTFYRNNKITCRKPQYQYGRKETLQQEIIKDQKLVAFQMAELIKKGKQVIYVDESTFNHWLVPRKTWIRRDMVLQMPSLRGTSISVIAGISEKQGLVHYKLISGSNDQRTFKDFVIEMVKKV